MTRLSPVANDIIESRAAAERLWRQLWPDPNATAHNVVLGKAIGTICRISDCYEPTMAFGMCNPHYKRHVRAVEANEAFRINYAATQHKGAA